MHNHLKTVMVAPMTTGAYPAPYRIAVTFEKKSGLILLDQMRAVDKSRLVKKLGMVADKTLAETLAALQEIFAK
jgi:mRNA interferase MazF